jgi:hypothetical protein
LFSIRNQQTGLQPQVALKYVSSSSSERVRLVSPLHPQRSSHLLFGLPGSRLLIDRLYKIRLGTFLMESSLDVSANFSLFRVFVCLRFPSCDLISSTLFLSNRVQPDTYYRNCFSAASSHLSSLPLRVHVSLPYAGLTVLWICRNLTACLLCSLYLSILTYLLTELSPS